MQCGYVCQGALASVYCPGRRTTSDIVITAPRWTVRTVCTCAVEAAEKAAAAKAKAEADEFETLLRSIARTLREDGATQAEIADEMRVLRLIRKWEKEYPVARWRAALEAEYAAQ